MKKLLNLFALGLLLTGAACSQDTVRQGGNPKKYKTSYSEASRRNNDKSRFRKRRNPGFGIDLNARNPYKSGTVTAPKDYKFDNKAGR
ncbi:hypothetical protein E5K00_08895 [Hymenobacter aquaticus]|uniref:Quinol oxidase subunit 4 n=1 Tax=Hymenobacter aquaticus TaxID=1867101 RepID=A0A4Z0Q5E3_9BACT|nr:hypothetical protein [Hymenobacter aquaticus]TGE25290.1 hypothetical protein E5K00_08895 [Hymenobacter aquaticus]